MSSYISAAFSAIKENIPYALDGVGSLTGPTLNGWVEKAKVASQKHDYGLKGLFQAIQVWSAMNRMMEAAKLAGSTFAIPPTVRWVCIGAPIAFALIRKTVDPLTVKLGQEHPVIVGFARRTFCLIEDHIGTASQVASLTSYIVIGFFGQPVVGAFGVAWVVVGFCDRLGVEVFKSDKPLPQVLSVISAIFIYMQEDLPIIGKALALQKILEVVNNLTASVTLTNPKRKPKAQLDETAETKCTFWKDGVPDLIISQNHFDLVEQIPESTVTEFTTYTLAEDLSDNDLSEETKKMVSAHPGFIYSKDREKGIVFFLNSRKAAYDAFIEKINEPPNKTHIYQQISSYRNGLKKEEQEEFIIEKINDPANKTGCNMYKRISSYMGTLSDEKQEEFIVRMMLNMENYSAERALFEAYYSATESDSYSLDEKIYRKLGQIREKLYWENELSENGGRAFGVPSLTLFASEPYLTNEKELTTPLCESYYTTMMTELKPFEQHIKEECKFYLTNLDENATIQRCKDYIVKLKESDNTITEEEIKKKETELIASWSRFFKTLKKDVDDGTLDKSLKDETDTESWIKFYLAKKGILKAPVGLEMIWRVPQTEQ